MLLRSSHSKIRACKSDTPKEKMGEFTRRVIDKPTNIKLCGFLQKERSHSYNLGTCKLRWFSLMDNNLTYYKQPGDTNSLGYLHIPKIKRIQRKTDKCFVIQSSKREWILHANTKENAEYWVRGLEKVRFGKNRLIGRSSQPRFYGLGIPVQQQTANKESNTLQIPSLEEKNKKVKFSPRQARRPLQRSSKAAPTSNVVFVEREKLKLAKLRRNKIEIENEEMSLLLKSLQMPKPYNPAFIEHQAKLEHQLSGIMNDITSCEAEIAISTSKIQQPTKQKTTVSIHHSRCRSIGKQPLKVIPIKLSSCDRRLEFD